MSKLEQINATTLPAQIRSAVPTDHHPDSLLAHGAVLVDSELTDSAAASYQSARLALRSIYESSAAIEDAHTACMADIKVGTERSSGRPIIKRDVDPTRAPALAAAMGESFTRVAHQIDATDQILGKTAEQLENAVGAALINKKANEVGTAQAAGEIRAYIARMKDSGERLNFLQRAVEEGDLETVAAVLQTSPFVSGLTRPELARIRDLAAQKFAPRAYKQLGSIRAVQQHLQRAQQSYVSTYFAKLPRAGASPADERLAKLRG